MNVYREAYNHYLIPVDDMDMWPTNSLNKSLPPKPRVMPGRPKKKRHRAAHEPRVGSTKVSKHGVTMTCQNCFEKGHNARSCKSEPKKNLEKKGKKKVGRPKKDVPQTSQSRRTPCVPSAAGVAAACNKKT